METTVSVEIVWGKHWVVLDSFWMLVVWAFRESVGFTEILLLLCINIFSFERSNECESVKWQGCDLCTAVESWARGGINITVYWTGKPERQSVNVHSLYWTGNQERQSVDVHSLYHLILWHRPGVIYNQWDQVMSYIRGDPNNEMHNKMNEAQIPPRHNITGAHGPPLALSVLSLY